MLRLKVNVRKLKPGALVSVEELGEDFAAQLLAAGHAEEEPDPEPVDPVEGVLHLVAEFGDQMEAVAARLSNIVAQAAPLDADDRVTVASALLAEMRRNPAGPEGLNELISLAPGGLTLWTANEPSGDGVSGAPSPGSDGTGGPDAAASQAVETSSGVAGEAGGAASTSQETAPNDKPPPDVGPSGDAGGASVSPVEPQPAPAPKPSRQPARAAKASAAS